MPKEVKDFWDSTDKAWSQYADDWVENNSKNRRISLTDGYYTTYSEYLPSIDDKATRRALRDAILKEMKYALYERRHRK